MSKSLKGTKSHENLKGAFAGESQANRRYLYFAGGPISKDTLTLAVCSAIRQRPKLAMPLGIWTFSKKSETPPPGCRSAIRMPI